MNGEEWVVVRRYCMVRVREKVRMSVGDRVLRGKDIGNAIDGGKVLRW